MRLCLVGILVVGAVSGSGAAVAARGTNDDVAGGARPESVVLADESTNNSTVHHENPETVDQQGSQRDIRKWLSGQMAALLSKSAIQISQGQYQKGRALLGERYREYLDKYVDVAGPTATDDANQVRELLNETRQNQRQYAKLLQRYNETYQEYLEARQNGNEQRARRLARQLATLTTRLQNTGANITRSYVRLENITGATLNNATQAITNTTSAISNQTQAIVRTTFIQTRLSIQAADQRVSFPDPLHVKGRLTTVNGTALTGTVTMRVGDQFKRLPVDADGTFEVVWRPRTASTGQKNLTIAYNPDSSAVYLGANATTTVTVEQVTPTLSVTVDDHTAKFGEIVTVRGRLAVNETRVSRIPIRIEIGDQTIARTATGGNGTFATNVTLPATIAAGDRHLRAVVPLTDRAIAGVANTTILQVRTTETQLTADAKWRDNSLIVTGQLLTVDGQPLADRQLRIAVANRTLETVRTDASGRYKFALSVGEIDIRRGTAVARVHFDGTGTNLAPVSAHDQFSVQTTGTGPSPTSAAGVLPALVTLPWIAGSVLVLILGLAIGMWYWRRDGDAESSPTPPTTETDTTATTDDAAMSESAPGVVALDAARDQLEAENVNHAVQSAYAAVRQRLRDTDAPTSTHWEFYDRQRNRLDDESSRALRTLTETYEQVAFAPTDIDQSQASTAVGAAQTLVDRE